MSPGPATATAMPSIGAPEAIAAPEAAPRRCWRRTAVYWLVALAVYWLTLFVGTHLPTQDMAGAAMDHDKLIHFAAYAVLTTMFCIAWRRVGGSPGLLGRMGVAAMVLAYGAIDEVSQPYFGRSCDLLDWVADAAGVFCALGLDAWRHRKG